VDGSSFTVASGAGLRIRLHFRGLERRYFDLPTGVDVHVGSSPVVLSAQWTPVTNSVTYAASGALARFPPKNLLRAEAHSVCFGAGITKSGFIFAGWSDGLDLPTGVDVYGWFLFRDSHCTMEIGHGAALHTSERHRLLWRGLIQVTPAASSR